MAANTDEGVLRPVRLTVGVTAHRDIPASETATVERLVGELFDELSRRFPDTPLQALCPLAEGGERAFARAAIARGIPLVVPLPLPRADYARDFDNAASREEFDELCAKARVFELPLRPGVEPHQVAEPGVLRDREYAKAGVFVSSHAQVLVAIWDGKPSDQLGGTAQIAHYRLYNLYPAHAAARAAGQEVLADDENDLTYHIVCSREREGGTPAPPLRALETAWLTGEPDAPRMREMPERHARTLAMTAEFNRDLRRWGGPHADGPPSLTEAGNDIDWPRGITHIARLFDAADRLANRFQRRLNSALRSTYILAALMGGVFVAYSTLPEQPPLLYAFLGLFVLGFGVYEVARRGAWHRKYLDYRVLSEGLRVQCYWSIAGIGNDGDGRFAYENFLQTQDPELGWIRHVMRDAELEATPPADTGEAGRDYVIDQWIGTGPAQGGSGQLGYYLRQAGLHYRLHRLTEGIGSLCLWSGMGIAVILAIFGTGFGHGTRTILLLLLGLLPLVAAVRGAYSHKRADKELIKQYRFMAHIFGNARRRLDSATDPEERREILRVLGGAALDEHAEWILMHRERPLEHSRF